MGWTDADSVDYSLVDGSPRKVVWDNDILYHKQAGIEKEGWKDALVSFVKKYDLGKKEPKHAFVYWMEEQGLLKDT